MVIYRLALVALLSCSVCVVVTGCVPVALGVGAAAGVAASKEKGISGELSDASIATSINDAWYRYNIDMFRKLNLTVDNGEVLITGVVQNPEHRVEAVRLAWSIEGVTKVINEIQVANSEGVGGYLKDTWIGTQLRAKMTAAADIHALNYSIEVVRGVVYLMGIARTQTELNDVIDLARNIQYVQNVVSYVRVSVEQAPVIQGASAQASPSVTSYLGAPISAQPTAPSSAGMKPIVDDPGF